MLTLMIPSMFRKINADMLRTRYMSPAAKQEAKRFWNG